MTKKVKKMSKRRQGKRRQKEEEGDTGKKVMISRREKDGEK